MIEHIDLCKNNIQCVKYSFYNQFLDPFKNLLAKI